MNRPTKKKQIKAPKTKRKAKVIRAINQINSHDIDRIYRQPTKKYTKIEAEKAVKDKILGSRIETNPMNLRNSKFSTKFAEQYRNNKIIEYLYGAIYPKRAVQHGLDVKLPSDLPIPSACIRVVKTYQITTGTLGNAFINYVPGSLLATNITTGGVISTLSVNTTCNGVGGAGANTFVDLGYAAVPQVYDKFRLVAAEMNVTYNGSVLTQAGTCYSCVHYEPCGYYKRGFQYNYITTNNGNMDRLSGNSQYIMQGLWNSKVNIVESGHGTTHVWTPDSSDNYTFPGFTTPVTTDSIGIVGTTGVTVSHSTVNTAAVIASSTVRGFVWYFTGLPLNSTCLLFETHEIYEYIPDISAVPIITLNGVSPTHKEYENISNTGIEKNSNSRKNISWKELGDKALNFISGLDLSSIAAKVMPMLMAL